MVKYWKRLDGGAVISRVIIKGTSCRPLYVVEKNSFNLQTLKAQYDVRMGMELVKL